jgi:rubredoxin
MIQELATLQAEQWTCVYCGYVYDQALGAPESGVAAGTPWEAVPEDWCCPMCGGEKSDFQKI